MPRKRSENPSPRALYMREYRERNATPEQLRAREIREQVAALRDKPAFVAGLKKAERRRRRDVYRAWQVLKVGHALSFRGDLVSTEEAIHILERGGRVNLLEARTRRESKPDYKPRKGRPKRKHLDTQIGVNAALRQAALAQGVQPISPDLGNPEDLKKETFGHRPVDLEVKPKPFNHLEVLAAVKQAEDAYVDAEAMTKEAFITEAKLKAMSPLERLRYNISRTNESLTPLPPEE